MDSLQNVSRKSCFIAHYVETDSLLLRWSKSLNVDFVNRRIRWFILRPLCALMSLIYLFARKAYDLVDQYAFGASRSETVIIRNFGWHFGLAKKEKVREKILQRTREAIMDAQKRGASVVGLGALLKDEMFSRGGQDFVRDLKNPEKARKYGFSETLRIPITHGDTLTAAVVFHQLRRILWVVGTDSPVFMTGATSKIGRGVALACSKQGIKLKMLTGSGPRFEKIRRAAVNPEMLTQVRDIADGADCPVWIIGKFNNPDGKKLISVIPKGAVVINFAVPDPLTSGFLKQRTDIIHLDGGLLYLDPEKVKAKKTLRLGSGNFYGCWAGTLVHGAMGWDFDDVGNVELARMEETYRAAMKLGFRLPKWTSHGLPANFSEPGIPELKLIKAV